MHTFYTYFQESGVHGVDAISLSRVIQVVATIEASSNQPQMQEKSPQSKFLDKIQSSVDKIDKKMKQIQVDGIQAVNKIDLTDPGKSISDPRTGRTARAVQGYDSINQLSMQVFKIQYCYCSGNILQTILTLVVLICISTRTARSRPWMTIKILKMFI